MTRRGYHIDACLDAAQSFDPTDWFFCMTAFATSAPPAVASCVRRLDDVLNAASSAVAAHVFTKLYDAQSRVHAQELDALQASGGPLGLLHGMCVTLKDNLDVAGEVTLSGGVVCAEDAPAAQDAVVVQRLRQAGALLVGKTNMSEFAFSGVGINPHHGTPLNPCDRQVARIPGGSSAGAAVAVALGLAEASVGTDTGGSIRIPAALCGLVGFKGTQSRTPLQGVMELSRSLDTVGTIARSVHACLQLDRVMSQQPLPLDMADMSGLRFAVPQSLMLDEMDSQVALAFGRALTRIAAAGATLVEIPFAELSEVAALNVPTGLSPIEGYAAHHARLARGADRIDPRVVARMMQGRDVSAKDYLALLNRRTQWQLRANSVLQDFDAMLSPTTPTVAAELKPLLDDDAAFFKVNQLMLRNPSVINFLDGCSFSLPCHEQGDLPVGLMVSASGGKDAQLARVALALEALLSAAH
jgi:aspartyl-tRNA(Asn)/glutamyl-tRNA(Gln) amidotransferase subunit A